LANLPLTFNPRIITKANYRKEKKDMSNETTPPISLELLEILRCPVAVHYKDRGDDPGRLELVHNCWLVSHDSGLKYPIRDGIPVMLIEEGEKWKNTPVADLPVPPPPA
jgi:uncharacterized protein YbaR (Trm112 family)